MALNNNKCFVGRNNPYNTEKHKKGKKINSFYNSKEYAYSKRAKEIEKQLSESMKSFKQTVEIHGVFISPAIEFLNDFLKNLSQFSTLEEAISECEIHLRKNLEKEYSYVPENVIEDTVEKIMIRAKRIITAYWNE